MKDDMRVEGSLPKNGRMESGRSDRGMESM
jgi:hypothetical protein